VNVLVDEQLSPKAADGINLFTDQHGMVASWIGEEAAGTKDPDIPALCQELGYEALYTVNVRDFGARLTLYEALVGNGVSVVVLRPGRVRLTPSEQVSLIVRHAARVSALLAGAEQPVLIKVTQAEVSAVRTLEELHEEILGPGRKLP
jgi:hypothetical protein